ARSAESADNCEPQRISRRVGRLIGTNRIVDSKDRGSTIEPVLRGSVERRVNAGWKPTGIAQMGTQEIGGQRPHLERHQQNQEYEERPLPQDRSCFSFRSVELRLFSQLLVMPIGCCGGRGGAYPDRCA